MRLLLGETPLDIETSPGLYPVSLMHVHGDEADAAYVMREWAARAKFHAHRIVSDTREIAFRYRERAYTIDPNRIFSRNGIETALDTTDPGLVDIVQRFASQFATLVTRQTIVALHNATDFNIGHYAAGGECVAAARDVHISPALPRNALILTTLERDFHSLQARDMNTVLLNDRSYPGSFSNYCVERAQRYFNIEAPHGDRALHRTLCDEVAALL